MGNDRLLKCLWFLPFLMVAYSFPETGFRFQVAIASATAAAAGCLVIKSAQYRMFSFVTISTLMFMVFYPIAAFLNLMIPSPAVVPRLWPHTDESMWACAYGMLSMALGSSLSRRFDFVSFKFLLRKTPIGVYPKISGRIFNVCLSSIFFLVVIIKIQLGLYYHITIAPYNFSASKYLNLLENLTWIGLCGIFLQFYRYIQTRNLTDLAISAFLFFAAIIAFLPSGSRMQSIGIIPPLFICYYIWEKSFKKKLFLIVTATATLVILTGVIGIYRNNAKVERVSLYSKFEGLLSIAKSEVGFENSVNEPEIDRTGTGQNASINVMIHRISDFVATGKIMSVVPEKFPYRGFEDLETWWQIYLPGFLRPTENVIDFNEGTKMTLKYNVSDGPWTSTPIMIISDLYSRFGWLGIVIGMFVIGFIYAKLDTLLERGNQLHKMIFFFLFLRFCWQLYVSSLLVTFTSVFREALIIYVVAFFIACIARTRMIQSKAESLSTAI